MYNLIFPGILLLALSNTLSASVCFLSENIECSCSETSFSCFGIQKEFTEVQQLLLNVSATHSTTDFLDLDWNIRNLTLESNFTFEGLKLQNLTIGSDLQNIPDALFFGLGSTLITLNLQHNNIELINNSAFSSLYNLKNLFLDFNNFSDINTDVFFNLSNLEFLSLSGNKLNRLESDFLVNLPSIHTLILDNNNFSSISDFKISSLSLKELFAKNCSLNGSLERDSLRGVQNMELIDFSSNHLVGMDSYAFSELGNLRVLNLSYNMIEYLKDHALSSLHNLRSLDLRNNKLLLIAGKSFMNLTNLKHLDLSGNRMEVFLQQYTADLFALESINLDNNKIKHITAGTFSASRNLQEILFEGNIFDCTCELSYFASYLFNNSHIRLGNSDVTCNTPQSMKGTALIKIDFVAMNCEEPDTDIPVSEDEDYDYTDVLNSTKLDEFTTENMTNDENTSTMHSTSTASEMFTTSFVDGSSTTTQRITTVYSVTSKSPTVDTTSFSPTFSTNEDLSTQTSTADSVTQRITTEYSVTSKSPTVDTTSFSPTFSTSEDLSTQTSTADSVTSISTLIVSTSVSPVFSTSEDLSTQTSTSNSLFLSSTIKEEETTPTPKTLESTTALNLFTTESTTAEDAEVTTQSEASKTVIHILDNFSLGKDFCVQWRISTNATKCETQTMGTKGLQRKGLKCPVSDTGIKTCINPEKTYKFCLIMYFNEKPAVQSCPEIPSLTTYTENMGIVSSSLPTSVISFSEDEDYDDYDTDSLSSTKLDELITEYTTSDDDSSTSPTLVTSPTSVIPSTSSKPDTTTKPPIMPTTLFKIPKPTKSKSVIPFKVISFDVVFNKMNAAAVIKWTVSKTEPRSICYLKLSFSTYNFNHTEGEFKCINNSYVMQNIEDEDYKLCLTSYHHHYKTQVLCNSSLGHSYELKASKSKDHGYTNSSLIAVICLLIVVLILIIIVSMKKMLKKRSESVIYNVSAEEQKIEKRTLQYRPESCVRYSYTVKEPI